MITDYPGFEHRDLNKDGTKWINVINNGNRVDRSPMDFWLQVDENTLVKRRADYFEAFGNFYVASFRIKGERYSGFFESFERIDSLPVLRTYSKRA